MRAHSPGPRPAATLLLLRDDPFEVLLIRRGAGGAFGLLTAFPGGKVEREDRDPAWPAVSSAGAEPGQEDRAFRIAAVRETFEETGILVGVDGPPPERQAPLREALLALRARVDLAGVLPISRWVTPALLPQRYDTVFLVAAVDRGREGDPDGVETTAADWLAPEEALEQARRGTRVMAAPTLANLLLLKRWGGVDAAIAGAAGRDLAPLHPRVLRRDDGSPALVIPATADYPAHSFPFPFPLPASWHEGGGRASPPPPQPRR